MVISQALLLGKIGIVLVETVISSFKLSWKYFYMHLSFSDNAVSNSLCVASNRRMRVANELETL
jgi:hypothetical protein